MLLALPRAPRPLLHLELWLISWVLPKGPGAGSGGGGVITGGAGRG